MIGLYGYCNERSYQDDLHFMSCAMQRSFLGCVEQPHDLLNRANGTKRWASIRQRNAQG